MIHSASLLHDDVVDQTPLRRGRPAAPKVYGNSTCVLVGDALMAQALCLLGELESRAPLLSLARCVRRMAVGEIQQLSQTGRPHPRLLGYLRVVEGKTSALFSWCCTVGDLCPDPLLAQMRSFGRRLGMAFQIADDVLDYAGNPEQTGKSVGSDLCEGKFTLPLHYACEEHPDLLELASRVGNATAPDEELVDRVVEQVRRSGGLERAREVARTLLRRAHRVLDNTPPTPWRDHLHAIADFVVQRSF
jgi:octaprenyl-diphosphate synthase